MKKEKMSWGGVSKTTYTAPEMSVYEFSADAVIMQMSGSSNSVPALGDTDMGSITWN